MNIKDDQSKPITVHRGNAQPKMPRNRGPRRVDVLREPPEGAIKSPTPLRRHQGLPLPQLPSPPALLFGPIRLSLLLVEPGPLDSALPRAIVTATEGAVGDTYAQGWFGDWCGVPARPERSVRPDSGLGGRGGSRKCYSTQRPHRHLVFHRGGITGDVLGMRNRDTVPTLKKFGLAGERARR